MNNKSIIQNAPESATHFDGVGAFYRETPSGYDYFCPKYGVISGEPLHDIINIRSLADIRRIVELEAENERLRKALSIKTSELKAVTARY